MYRVVLAVIFAATVFQGHVSGQQQLQMPIGAELNEPEKDLQTQIHDLQRNVSEIWSYIHELRNAVSGHLTHLREHQMELESTVHRMEHLHDGDSAHSGDSHHHSGEQHSHSEEKHAHSSEHSHGPDGDEHHSHGDEHHSHADEHHSHSSEHGHYSHSHSHSHSHDHSKEDSHTHDHSKEDSHSHGHDHSKEDSHSHNGSGHNHDNDHKDSHESEDFSQQIQKVSDPLAEPVVAPTNRHEHDHSHSSWNQAGRTGNTNSLNLMNEHYHHHHHHHHRSSSKNRTVELPKYSEYNMFDFAVCTVQANRAISQELQQNIAGQVTLWQRKTGGPLNLHVRLQGFDVSGHQEHHGDQQIVQDNEAPIEEVGHKHGFHIHTSGDLSNGCQSTGPHYNPKGVDHGGPTALVRHVGDLGNIECDEHGDTNILFSDSIASLQGQYSVIGKSMVIHANADDFGLGGNAESLKTGNAGTRLACCVIEKVDKLPIRNYKAMKTASQYKNY